MLPLPLADLFHHARRAAPIFSPVWLGASRSIFEQARQHPVHVGHNRKSGTRFLPISPGRIHMDYLGVRPKAASRPVTRSSKRTPSGRSGRSSEKAMWPRSCRAFRHADEFGCEEGSAPRPISVTTAACRSARRIRAQAAGIRRDDAAARRIPKGRSPPPANCAARRICPVCPSVNTL